jgi:hypothetical protein
VTNCAPVFLLPLKTQTTMKIVDGLCDKGWKIGEKMKK